MEENGMHERRTGMSAAPQALREALVALLPRLRRFARAGPGRARRRRSGADRRRAGVDALRAAAAGRAAVELDVRHRAQRLPEEQCEAVALVLIEGFSYKEAAHIMEVPIGTLTSRLARGREALQEMLDESGRTRR